MASSKVRVDTAGVRTAGATAAVAGATASPPAPAVPPCAADATSVAVATRAAGQISTLGRDTTATNLVTDAAAARLHADADAYDIQEATATTDLADATAAVDTGAQVPNVPVPETPDTPTMPGVPVGCTPTTGHEIANVIHAGAGPNGVLAVAAQLDATAADLDAAAAGINGANGLVADSWASDAADTAADHLERLQHTYTGQAVRARILAARLRSHADDFTRARAQIPPPQRFTDLETRLQVLYAANAHPTSLGRYTQQITDLQLALAAANNDAVNGYHRYTEAAQIQAGTIDSHSSDRSGPQPHRAPDGTGGTRDSANTGQDAETRTPADPSTKPSAGPAGADGVGDTAGTLMGSVLPAVLGGVSGAAGGLLGALSGAGKQLQQAGSQLANGLAQGAGAAMNPSPADASPGSGGQPQLPTPDALDDGGGGPQPGDTEPAGGVGAPALAAPAGAAAVPAAAPATFSAAPSVTSGAGGGVSGGMGMMPQMMPMAGHPSSGGGEDDRRLYPERRMRVETPPNSEPVKGRREARRTRAEKNEGG